MSSRQQFVIRFFYIDATFAELFIIKIVILIYNKFIIK